MLIVKTDQQLVDHIAQQLEMAQERYRAAQRPNLKSSRTLLIQRQAVAEELEVILALVRQHKFQAENT